MTHLVCSELRDEEFDEEFVPSHQSSYESDMVVIAGEVSEGGEECDLVGGDEGAGGHTPPRPDAEAREHAVSADPGPVDVLEEDFGALPDQQLWALFGAFTPAELPLETVFVPFLQDYQPAVGEPDVGVRVQRPDGAWDPLGCAYADEPCVHQSQAYALAQRLQAGAPADTAGAPQAETVRRDERYRQRIDAFIADVEAMRRDRPAYTTNVDNFYDSTDLYDDDLLERLDAVLAGPGLSRLDLDLTQFVRLCCGILDVVYDERDAVGSCYQLFNIYDYVRRAGQHEPLE